MIGYFGCFKFFTNIPINFFVHASLYFDYFLNMVIGNEIIRPKNSFKMQIEKLILR